MKMRQHVFDLLRRKSKHIDGVELISEMEGEEIQEIGGPRKLDISTPFIQPQLRGQRPNFDTEFESSFSYSNRTRKSTSDSKESLSMAKPQGI